MAPQLKREANMPDPDAVYALLIDAHVDLTEAESLALGARLALLLANHIGDIEVLRQAVATARGSMGKPPTPGSQ